MLIDSVTYYITMLQVYGAMALMIIVLPAFMWRSYFRRHKRGVGFRFLFYVLTQECFLTNLVLLLGFLKIANRWSLLLGIAIEYVIVRWKTHYLPNITAPRKQRYQLNKPVTMSNIRNYIRHRLLDLRIRLSKYRDWEVWAWLRKHWFLALLLTGVVVYNCWFINYNLLHEGHCYQFSDIPVHTDWVYMLTHGKLFSSGIYPFYMHAMIYAVHTLSGIHLREVVLYFGAGQTLLMIGSIFMLGRKLFKNDYVALVPLAFFSVLMNNGRYSASLPQESGMFACVALAYFLLNYLQNDRTEHHVVTDSRVKGFFRLNAFWFRRYMTMDLMMIMICVASVIGFHFYTAIAAIILVFAFAVAYLPRLFAKRYWLPLLTAGILGAVIAVTPFIACLAQGIPFQGSMAWAMSLINGEEWVNEEQDSYAALLNGENAESKPVQDETPAESVSADPEQHKAINLKDLYLYLSDTVLYAVPPGGSITLWMTWGIMAICGLFGMILYLFRKARWIGAGYITLVIYCLIMLVLGSVNALGLPELVERQRIPVFIQPFAYVMAAVPVDLLVRALTAVWKKKGAQIVTSGMALAVCAGLIALCVTTGNAHHYFDLNRAYYNEVDYLLRNIRGTFPAKSFIVVSPTDDYYGVVDEGYHTELSEMMSMVEGNRKEFTLPAQYNFFFVEKQVMQDINYGATPITPELARKQFIFTGLTQDYFHQRAVLESKAYYWAQAMLDAYPEAFTVFFEDDYVVAYLLVQNPYYPYDLRVDFSSYLDEV